MAFSSLPWFQVWRYEGAVVLYADNHTRTQKTARLACWVPSFSFILPLGWAHFYAPIKRIERLQFTGFFFVCLFVFLWRCAVPVGAIRSIDFDRFRLKMSFDWVLPSFHTEQILPAKMTAIKGENTCELGFFSSFTGFYQIILGFTGFYRVLPGFTGFYWVCGYSDLTIRLTGERHSFWGLVNVPQSLFHGKMGSTNVPRIALCTGFYRVFSLGYLNACDGCFVDPTASLADS